MKVTDSDICERCEVAPVAGYALAEPGATLMLVALCEKCLATIEDDWKTGPRRMPSGKTERKVTGGKGDTEAKARKNAERAVMDADRITCCNQCKQPLIEIDNGGERLKGCLTCNLWSTVDRKLWKRLSEEDLRALYALVRDHYLIRMPRHEKRAADRSRRTEVALKTCS